MSRKHGVLFLLVLGLSFPILLYADTDSANVSADKTCTTGDYKCDWDGKGAKDKEGQTCMYGKPCQSDGGTASGSCIAVQTCKATQVKTESGGEVAPKQATPSEGQVGNTTGGGAPTPSTTNTPAPADQSTPQPTTAPAAQQTPTQPQPVVTQPQQPAPQNNTTPQQLQQIANQAGIVPGQSLFQQSVNAFLSPGNALDNQIGPVFGANSVQDLTAQSTNGNGSVESYTSNGTFAEVSPSAGAPDSQPSTIWNSFTNTVSGAWTSFTGYVGQVSDGIIASEGGNTAQVPPEQPDTTAAAPAPAYTLPLSPNFNNYVGPDTATQDPLTPDEVTKSIDQTTAASTLVGANQFVIDSQQAVTQSGLDLNAAQSNLTDLQTTTGTTLDHAQDDLDDAQEVANAKAVSLGATVKENPDGSYSTTFTGNPTGYAAYMSSPEKAALDSAGQTYNSFVQANNAVATAAGDYSQAALSYQVAQATQVQALDNAVSAAGTTPSTWNAIGTQLNTVLANAQAGADIQVGQVNCTADSCTTVSQSDVDAAQAKLASAQADLASYQAFAKTGDPSVLSSTITQAIQAGSVPQSPVDSFLRSVGPTLDSYANTASDNYVKNLTQQPDLSAYGEVGYYAAGPTSPLGNAIVGGTISAITNGTAAVGEVTGALQPSPESAVTAQINPQSWYLDRTIEIGNGALAVYSLTPLAGPLTSVAEDAVAATSRTIVADTEGTVAGTVGATIEQGAVPQLATEAAVAEPAAITTVSEYKGAVSSVTSEIEAAETAGATPAQIESIATKYAAIEESAPPDVVESAMKPNDGPLQVASTPDVTPATVPGPTQQQLTAINDLLNAQSQLDAANIEAAANFSKESLSGGTPSPLAISETTPAITAAEQNLAKAGIEDLPNGQYLIKDTGQTFSLETGKPPVSGGTSELVMSDANNAVLQSVNADSRVAAETAIKEYENYIANPISNPSAEAGTVASVEAGYVARLEEVGLTPTGEGSLVRQMTEEELANANAPRTVETTPAAPTAKDLARDTGVTAVQQTAPTLGQSLSNTYQVAKGDLIYAAGSVYDSVKASLSGITGSSFIPTVNGVVEKFVSTAQFVNALVPGAAGDFALTRAVAPISQTAETGTISASTRAALPSWVWSAQTGAETLAAGGTETASANLLNSVAPSLVTTNTLSALPGIIESDSLATLNPGVNVTTPAQVSEGVTTVTPEGESYTPPASETAPAVSGSVAQPGAVSPGTNVSGSQPAQGETGPASAAPTQLQQLQSLQTQLQQAAPNAVNSGPILASQHDTPTAALQTLGNIQTLLNKAQQVANSPLVSPADRQGIQQLIDPAKTLDQSLSDTMTQRVSSGAVVSEQDDDALMNRSVQLGIMAAGVTSKANSILNADIATEKLIYVANHNIFPASYSPVPYTAQETQNLVAQLHLNGASDPVAALKILPPKPAAYPQALPVLNNVLSLAAPVSSLNDQQIIQLINTSASAIQQYWGKVFAQNGGQYRPASIVIVDSSKGTVVQGQINFEGSGSNSFIPDTGNVQIDLATVRNIQYSRVSNATGVDIAESVAHEIGHYVARVTGVDTTSIHQLVANNYQAPVSVVTGYSDEPARELEADYLAGVAMKGSGLMAAGNPQQLYYYVATAGDDFVDVQGGVPIDTSKYTHGTGADRAGVFYQGLVSGDPMGAFNLIGVAPNWKLASAGTPWSQVALNIKPSNNPLLTLAKGDLGQPSFTATTPALPTTPSPTPTPTPTPAPTPAATGRPVAVIQSDIASVNQQIANTQSRVAATQAQLNAIAQQIGKAQSIQSVAAQATNDVALARTGMKTTTSLWSAPQPGSVQDRQIKAGHAAAQRLQLAAGQLGNATLSASIGQYVRFLNSLDDSDNQTLANQKKVGTDGAPLLDSMRDLIASSQSAATQQIQALQNSTKTAATQLNGLNATLNTQQQARAKLVQELHVADANAATPAPINPQPVATIGPIASPVSIVKPSYTPQNLTIVGDSNAQGVAGCSGPNLQACSSAPTTFSNTTAVGGVQISALPQQINALSPGTKIAIVAGGNDAGNAAATVAASVQAVINAANARGVTIVAWAGAPSDPQNATLNQQLATVNGAIKSALPSNIPYVDLYSNQTIPSSARSGYHLTAQGYQLAGQAILASANNAASLPQVAPAPQRITFDQLTPSAASPGGNFRIAGAITNPNAPVNVAYFNYGIGGAVTDAISNSAVQQFLGSCQGNCAIVVPNVPGGTATGRLSTAAGVQQLASEVNSFLGGKGVSASALTGSPVSVISYSGGYLVGNAMLQGLNVSSYLGLDDLYGSTQSALTAWSQAHPNATAVVECSSTCTSLPQQAAPATFGKGLTIINTGVAHGSIVSANSPVSRFAGSTLVPSAAPTVQVAKAIPGMTAVPQGTQGSAAQPVVSVVLPGGATLSYQASSPQVATAQGPIQAWLAKNVAAGTLPANASVGHFLATPAASAPAPAVANTPSAQPRIINATMGGGNPIIINAMTQASRYLPPGYSVEVISTARGPGQSDVGNSSFHIQRDSAGNSLAVDVTIINDQGVRLVNPSTGSAIRTPQYFGIYRNFMQNVKALQDATYPQYKSQGRWGGYFVTGDAQDLMHYDLGPANQTVAGTWQSGLLPQYANYGLPGQAGQGMGTNYQVQVQQPDGTSAPAPRFDIYDQAGKLVQSGVTLPASVFLDYDPAIIAYNLNHNASFDALKGGGYLTVSADNVISRVNSDGTQSVVGRLNPSASYFKTVADQNPGAGLIRQADGTYADASGHQLRFQAVQPVYNAGPFRNGVLDTQTASQIVPRMQQAQNVFRMNQPGDQAMFLGILSQETLGLNTLSKSPANAFNIGQSTRTAIQDLFQSGTPAFIQSPLVAQYGSADQMFSRIASGDWQASIDGMVAEAANLRYRYGCTTNDCIIAGYNGGPNRGQRYVAGLSVPVETANYVPRVNTWSRQALNGQIPANQSGSAAWSALISSMKNGNMNLPASLPPNPNAPLSPQGQGTTPAGNGNTPPPGAAPAGGDTGTGGLLPPDVPPSPGVQYQPVLVDQNGVVVSKVGGLVTGSGLLALGAGAAYVYSTDSDGKPNGAIQGDVSPVASGGMKAVVLATDGTTGQPITDDKGSVIAYDPTTIQKGAWNPTGDTYTIDTNPPPPPANPWPGTAGNPYPGNTPTQVGQPTPGQPGGAPRPPQQTQPPYQQPPQPIPRPLPLPLVPPVATSTATSTAPALSIVANPATIQSGKQALVSWSSVGTATCTVESSSGYTLGSTTQGSEFSPDLSTTTLFTMQCKTLTNTTIGTSTSVLVQ